MDKALAMKIWNVMDESEKLEKSMTVGKGNNSYSAISEADVLNGIKPLLKKFKLIIIPIDVEITELTDFYKTSSTYNGNTTVNDKARLMTQLKTKWKIVDVETGEFEILASPGNGADPQDKGSGKAWTYAYKNLIQKTFCLFSGEDTDNTHSKDIMPKQLKPTNINCNALITLGASKNIKAADIEKVAVHDFGHGLEFISKAEYDQLLEKLEKAEAKE